MVKEIIAQIQQSFEAASASWYSAIFPFAKKLFFTLAAIELCWAAIKWTIQHEDPMSIIMSLLRHIVALSFFFAILIHPDWLNALIKGFEHIGAAAAQLDELKPEIILARGALIAKGVLAAVADVGVLDMPIAAFAAAIISIIVIISFSIIAAQMLITIIESKIVISAGMLLLGFAGSSWTKTYAERFLSYAVGVGIKLFVIYLITGIGMNLSKEWIGVIEGFGQDKYTVLLAVGGASLVFGFISWQIPSIASSMLSGQVVLTLGGFAASVIGGAAVVGSPLGSGVRGMKVGTEIGKNTMEAYNNVQGSGLAKSLRAGLGATGAVMQHSAEAGIRTLRGRTHSYTAESIKHERDNREKTRENNTRQNAVVERVKDNSSSTPTPGQLESKKIINS